MKTLNLYHYSHEQDPRIIQVRGKMAQESKEGWANVMALTQLELETATSISKALNAGADFEQVGAMLGAASGALIEADDFEDALERADAVADRAAETLAKLPKEPLSS